MLSGIRKAAKSWLAFVLLGLVLIAMLVTGIYSHSDPFAIFEPSANVLASVGGKTVTTDAFNRRFNIVWDQQRQQHPEVTKAELAKAGADREVLEVLLSGAAIDAFAERQGVTIGPAQVAEALRNIPAFSLAGQFDVARYKEVLAQNRISQKDFETEFSHDLVRDQFGKALASEGRAPAGVARAYVSLLLEQRTAEIARIPLDRFSSAVGTPTDAQLLTYRDQNKTRFSVPELRRFSYVTLDVDTIVATIQPTDEQLRAAYKERLAEFGGIEQRTLDQALAPDRASADKLIAAVKGGASFAAAAQSVLNLSAEDIALGKLTRDAFAKQADAAVADAVFAAQKGAIVGPLQAPLGFYVVHVADIAAANARPYEEVKPQLTAQLQRDQAIDKLFDVSRQLDDKLAAGTSLADAARQLKLPLGKAGPVSVTGRGADGQATDLPPSVQAALPTVFVQKSDDAPHVEQAGENSYYAVAIDDVIPSKVRALDEIRDGLLAAWKQEQAAKRAQALAEKIMTAVRKGGNLPALAKAEGLQPVQTGSAIRVQVLQNQNAPPPIKLMFALPAGDVGYAPSPGDLALFVVHVTASTPGNPASPQGRQMLEATRRDIGQLAGREFSQSFALATRQALGVTYNQKTISAVRSQLLGEAN